MNQPTFFELRTPRDMLEKAMRERQRLRNDFSLDNIFNFFVTAYHIRDYVKEVTAISASELKSFLADPDLQDCRALCNKGKHLRLTGHPDALTDISSGGFGCNAFGEGAFGENEMRKLFYGNRAVDVRALPDRVIQKWEGFLARHGL